MDIDAIRGDYLSEFLCVLFADKIDDWELYGKI